MKIIKSPLRVSLFGGGTDIPEYYEQHGATIISFALDKSIYLIHNGRPTGGCRLSYGKVEEVNSLLEV
jgi:D-glycero-alpha-D-manno-heptose-7-phosphate kinase